MPDETPVWSVRFDVPYLMTARPVRGSQGLALLVFNTAETARGVVADLLTEDRSPQLGFPVDVWSAALTPNGRWVLQIADDGGSEIGHVLAYPVDGGSAVDLTPGRPPYVLRGLDVSVDGSTVVLSTVDDEGFHLLVVPLSPFGVPRVVHSTPHEAWWGRISADGRFASYDTTTHRPGMRRTAVTVVDVENARIVAVLNDLPDGPARACCFSETPGDNRLLVGTERTGFVRPCVWDPNTGRRRDYSLPELPGEVIPLDWCSRQEKILAAHAADGIQTIIEIDERTGEHEVVSASNGSYFEPDVGSTYPHQYQPWYLTDGSIVLTRSRWDVPLHLIRVRPDETKTVVEPAPVPTGHSFDSTLITSRDGTRVQLWLAHPDRPDPIGTVLEVHGGPNLATVDRYSPSAQGWLDEGFAYASLNYRGSVTFGQRFREGFWQALGQRELDDIDAAVHSLRGRGLARPGTTFITGPSYGGFLTLFAAGRLPDHFAGGFAHVAVGDWQTALAGQNAAQRDVWKQWIGGSPEEFMERAARYSPLSYVEHVRASVWLNQGTHDTRTPLAQAQTYADALAAAGGDVVIERFEGGHEPTGLKGMRRDQLRMTELAHRTLRGESWGSPGRHETTVEPVPHG